MNYRTQFARIYPMSKESQTRISWEDVKNAEVDRFHGRRKTAIQKVEAARIDPQEVSSLSKKELIIHLAAWRIDVDANIALSKRTISGKKALENLEEAHNVMENYYNHLDVSQKVGEIKKDIEDNPYEFIVEMLRDKGRYSRTLHELTGNYVFLKDAIYAFDAAIDIAEEITGQGLNKMEAGMIREDYNQVKAGYEEVYPEAVKRGNIDRARWSSKTWLFEALKRKEFKDTQKAWQDSIVANNGLKETLKYFGGNEIPKFFVGAFLHFIRKSTLPEQIDFKKLRIK